MESIHVGIHQALAFFRFIPDAVGTVYPLIKFFGHLAAKAHPGFFAQFTGDLPPGRNFVLRVGVFPQQFLVPLVRQGVVFQGIGSGQTVLPHHLHLFLNGIEIILNKPAGFLVRFADEVVNVDNDGLFHGGLPI